MRRTICRTCDWWRLGSEARDWTLTHWLSHLVSPIDLNLRCLQLSTPYQSTYVTRHFSFSFSMSFLKISENTFWLCHYGVFKKKKIQSILNWGCVTTKCDKSWGVWLLSEGDVLFVEPFERPPHIQRVCKRAGTNCWWQLPSCHPSSIQHFINL